MDYTKLAEKFGGSPAPSIDYGALAAEIESPVPVASQAPTPDPRGIGSGPAMRAGAQVLAPINAQAAIDSLVDAGRVANELPGAVMGVWKDYAGGALKGLGGIADAGIKALGLPRSDYADAAFEPSNPVQSVGKGAAQMGTAILGTEAALAGMGLSPLGSLIAKFITSPVGAGTTQAGVEMAQGVDPVKAAQHGAMTASGLGAIKLAPAAIQVIRKVFPKATPEEINVAAQDAKAFLEASRAKMAAREASRPPIVQPGSTVEEMKAAVEAGPRGAAAKRAMAESREAAKPPVMPSAPPTMAQAAPEAQPMAAPVSASAMSPQAPPVVSEIRPIPPQKLPPVLPDPMVPELAAPAGSAAKLSGAGQNARDWLQKYAEAGKGGTKAEVAAARAKLVKGLSGKLGFEDMRQLGAYTDDISTVNPGAPPPAVMSTFRPVKLEDVPRVTADEADDLLAKLEASIKNPKLRDQVAVERAKRSKKLRTKENK